MLNGIKYHRAFTGSEIAREMGITRQAVSQSLKRGVTKMYYGLQEHGVTKTPTETIMHMRDYLGISDQEDIEQFFELFPKKIRDEIKEDARNYTINKQ